MELNKLLSALNVDKADWVGLRKATETTMIHAIRDLKPEQHTTNISSGIMVEVLYQGQFAYAATPNLSIKEVQHAFDRAFRDASQAANYGIYKFNEEVRPGHHGRYKSPYQVDFNSISNEQINYILIKANEVMQMSDKIKNVLAMLRIVETDMEYVSTSGSDIKQNFNFIGLVLQAIAEHQGVIQKRSDADSHQQGGLEHFTLDNVIDRATKVASEALELLEADECPNDKMDVILDPDQMLLQIHESIGHALEIDRILGDERNYAGWSFVQLEDFGKLKYGSNLLNVSFDPTLEGEYASYGYDDSGYIANKEYLIQNGILMRGLGGLESQKRANIDGVANFRSCSWNRAPIDRMANINLEPGNSSIDDMISSIEHGIYIQTNRCWSIDDFRRKFQFGCEYGKLIENGKLTKTVKNPNYRAITVPFWNSLDMVGNKASFKKFGTPYCGKGEPNQSIRVGHAAPMCKFKKIDVFGGS